MEKSFNWAGGVKMNSFGIGMIRMIAPMKAAALVMDMNFMG